MKDSKSVNISLYEICNKTVELEGGYIIYSKAIKNRIRVFNLRLRKSYQVFVS